MKATTNMKRPLIIGIGGGSASGKSAISQRIVTAFQNSKSLLVLKMDDYYNDQAHLKMEERVKTNYDHPFAFDFKLMVQQLDELMALKKINKPTYDFVNHTRSDIYEEVNPAEVIILEGLFVLEEQEIRARCDIKVYVDAPADIRFIRRLTRDVKERGRTMESVVGQYITTVREMHELFIEPSKKFADVIIPEGGHNIVAIDLLITKISSILYGNVV